MRTTLTCLLGAAVLALAGCGGTARTADSASAATKPTAAKTTDAAIDRDLKTITYEGEDGETALDLLRDAGYDVTVESSELGDFVTAIGDVTSTKSEYWLFEADGRMPSVGADVYETRDGEQLQWRFGS